MKIKRLRIQSQGEVIAPQLEVKLIDKLHRLLWWEGDGTQYGRYLLYKQHHLILRYPGEVVEPPFEVGSIDESPQSSWKPNFNQQHLMLDYNRDRHYATRVELCTDEEGKLTDPKGRGICCIVHFNPYYSPPSPVFIDQTKILHELSLKENEFGMLILYVTYEGENKPVFLGCPTLAELVYPDLELELDPEHASFSPFPLACYCGAKEDRLKLSNALTGWAEKQWSQPRPNLKASYPDDTEDDREWSLTAIDVVAQTRDHTFEKEAIQAIELKLMPYALLIFQGARQRNSSLHLLQNQLELIAMVLENILKVSVKTQKGKDFLWNTIYRHLTETADCKNPSPLTYLYHQKGSALIPSSRMDARASEIQEHEKQLVPGAGIEPARRV